MAIQNGYRVFEWQTAVTQAASPATTPFIDTAGFTRVLPFFATAGGTTVITIEGSTDGSTLDADLTAITLTSGTQADIPYPYIRLKITQTVADSTKTKIYVQARA